MSIKLADNKLKSLRIYFREKLYGIYAPEEIDAFFYRGINHFFNIDRLHFHSDLNRQLSESDILKIRNLALELRRFRPIQYILGQTTFYDIPLYVNKNVLIPRPETEEMVRAVFDKLNKEPTQIFDFCTGSGCIALALKNRYKKAQVLGIDLSLSALEVAKRNAESTELDVHFKQDNLLHPEIDYSFADLIVANPPYVTLNEKAEMEKNVLDFEPGIALFVPDNDPLIFYRAILSIAVEKLRPDGWIFFEINEKFGNSVLALMQQSGIDKNLELADDLNGKPRWVCGQKTKHD